MGAVVWPWTLDATGLYEFADSRCSKHGDNFHPQINARRAQWRQPRRAVPAGANSWGGLCHYCSASPVLFFLSSSLQMTTIRWRPWSPGRTSRGWCRGRSSSWWGEDTHWLPAARLVKNICNLLSVLCLCLVSPKLPMLLIEQDDQCKIVIIISMAQRVLKDKQKKFMCVCVHAGVWSVSLDWQAAGAHERSASLGRHPAGLPAGVGGHRVCLQPGHSHRLPAHPLSAGMALAASCVSLCPASSDLS